MFNRPVSSDIQSSDIISSDILEQAVTNIMKAVTIEETALSNILNLANDITQQAKNGSASLDEFVSLSKSVNCVLHNIARVQRMTQMKLRSMKKIIQTMENLNESDALEE